MSPDEVMVLLFSGFVGLLLWALWYVTPLRVQRLGAPPQGRPIVFLAPPLAGLLLFAVLTTVSAGDVRDDPVYIGFYLVLGAAWVGAGVHLLPLVGVSVRDDVAERANRAAAHAVGGAVLAIALCYAGGNIGNGPGWWVVLCSAALATATLFALWIALDALTGLSDTVTVDRDEAAGIRLAGFLVGASVILGRAVAGDWASAGATVRDFVMTAWPALLLLGVAAMVERRARPTPERPAPAVATYGALPALAYVIAGVLAALGAGPAW